MKTKDIYINGIIGDSFWYEGISSKDFIAEFKAAEAQYDRINIHINSPGGDVWEGLAIFNTILASKKQIHTYNIGICASMGANILLAGDTVHAAKSSLTLLHNVWGLAVGNAKELRKAAESMDKHDDVLAEHVAGKLDITKDEVMSRFMDYDDHMFTAKEAKDEGLVDEVEDYHAKDAPDKVDNMTREQLLGSFKIGTSGTEGSKAGNILNEIVNKVQAAMSKKNKQSNKEVEDMFTKLNALAEKAKKGEALSAEEIQAVNDELKAGGLEGYSIAVEAREEGSDNALANELNNLFGDAAQADDFNVVDAVKGLQDGLRQAQADKSKVEEDLKAEKAKPKVNTVPEKTGDDKLDKGEPSADEVLDSLPHNQAADEVVGDFVAPEEE